MSKLNSIGSIQSTGSSDFDKVSTVYNINECISLAQKGMGNSGRDSNGRNSNNEMYNFFGYKDLNRKEIVDKINDCDGLLKYYKSMDCRDKKMVKPTLLSSTKYASIFGNKFPVITKFQELGCQNKQAFNNVLDKACKVVDKYPHGECWLAPNDKTKNAIFTNVGDVNIYVTPDKKNGKQMTKEQLQISRIDGDIELTSDKIRALENEQEYNKLYKKAIKEGKSFDEVYKQYTDENRNKEDKTNMREISDIIYKLQGEKSQTYTVNKVLRDLRREKKDKLRDVNSGIQNNDNTLRYIDDRISFLSNKIDTNNKEYNKKSEYINYIKIGILVVISLGIIGIGYKARNKLPQIKKAINNTINNTINTVRNTPSKINNSVNMSKSLPLSFNSISKMINQNFNI